MSTIIKAGNATDGMSLSADTAGALEFKTGIGSGTTALTISNAQNATFAGSVIVTGSSIVTGSETVGIIKSTSTSQPTMFQNSAGTEIGTLCRAWVNFGYVSSAVTIRSSFNVSGVTRTALGYYTITFTNALPDANYSMAGAGSQAASSGTPFYAYAPALAFPNNISASSVNIITMLYGAAADMPYVFLAFFR
jgi:hypothetical protein